MIIVTKLQVQVIPHITNEIKRRFYRGEDKIAIIEVGGTVGDMESQAFLEAIRQFQNEVGKENAIILLVTLFIIQLHFMEIHFLKGLVFSHIMLMGVAAPCLLQCSGITVFREAERRRKLSFHTRRIILLSFPAF